MERNIVKSSGHVHKLLQAFKNVNIQVITILLERKLVDPNVLLPDKGVTPFHLIIGHDSENFAFHVVKLFLRFRGDPNIGSNDCVTPVHVAAAWGRVRILHLLLINGGDPWLQDDERKTAFNYAFEEEKWSAVQMLHYFQLMHTDVLSHSDINNSPRYKLDLEKVAFSNRDGLLVEYATKENFKQTVMTQTSCFSSTENISCSENIQGTKEFSVDIHNSNNLLEQNVSIAHPVSPEVDKEPHFSDSVENWKKDIYQTTCDVIVHRPDVFTSPSKLTLPIKEKPQIDRAEIPSVQTNSETEFTKKINPCDKFSVNNLQGDVAINEPTAKTKKSFSFNHGTPCNVDFKLDSNTVSCTSFVNKLDQKVNTRKSFFIKKDTSDNLDLRSKLMMELKNVFRTKSCKNIRAPLDHSHTIQSSTADSGKNSNVEESISINSNLSAQENEQQIPRNIYLCESGITPFNMTNSISKSSSFDMSANQDFKNSNENNTETTQPRATTTINLCSSAESMYKSCSSMSNDVIRAQSSKCVSTLYVPLQKPNSNVFEAVCGDSKSIDVTNQSLKLSNIDEHFVTVCEEYKYSDEEADVVLVEKRLVLPTSNCFNAIEEVKGSTLSINSVHSQDSKTSVASIPSNLSYDTDSLRTELKDFGYNPGPIFKTTKKLYLKKLYRLKKQNNAVPNDISRSPYNNELEKTLKSIKFYEAITSFYDLEEDMSKLFNEPNSKRRWREGNYKTSFNYLLLDPRQTLNLPKRSKNMDMRTAWQCFLSSIFYIGKGKKSRPYAHLYQAASYWKKRQIPDSDAKTEQVIEIWNCELGVVYVHVFHNVIPAEAFTREAAMIEAIGVRNLKNKRIGDYYGTASTWASKKKCRLGVCLLHKALLVFLSDGERQIRPADLQ